MFNPAHLLKANFDRYIESGGEVKISKKTEKRIFQFFVFIFNAVVFNNIPSVITKIMMTAFEAIDVEWDDGEWVEGGLTELKKFMTKIGKIGKFETELEKFCEDNNLHNLYNIWKEL